MQPSRFTLFSTSFLLLALALAGCASPKASIETDVSLASFGVNGDPFLGNPDAEIQVVAYEAPGCSSCKWYHGNAFESIKTDFIDTGKIGYHFLQWKVGYAYDLSGGVAEECAFREGGTEAYLFVLDEVFAMQNNRDEREAKLPVLLEQAAETFALDKQALQSCFENEETLEEVNADIALGRESGAGYNPGFAVIKGDEVKIVQGSSGPRDAIEAFL